MRRNGGPHRAGSAKTYRDDKAGEANEVAARRGKQMAIQPFG